MVLGVYGIACALFDFENGKIPNILHILYLVYLIATFQIKPIIYVVIVTILLLPIYYFKLFGAGDIKMFIIVIASIGVLRTMKIFIISSIFCITISVIKMAAKKELIPRFYYLINYTLLLLNKNKDKYKLEPYKVRFGFYFGIVTALWSL